ncbi:hypothetical protein TAL182_PC00297 (plasmid) [Rhizobium sp. TAL182]|nr:hypothetical protein TAL182_PC00297 [Rhizobium sp. TAL182]
MRENPFLRGHVQRANPDETIPSAGATSNGGLRMASGKLASLCVGLMVECRRLSASRRHMVFGHALRA